MRQTNLKKLAALSLAGVIGYGLSALAASSASGSASGAAGSSGAAAGSSGTAAGGARGTSPSRSGGTLTATNLGTNTTINATIGSTATGTTSTRTNVGRARFLTRSQAARLTAANRLNTGATALGVSGGRPVTLNGMLLGVDSFFGNGTTVTPMLQGTAISNATGTTNVQSSVTVANQNAAAATGVTPLSLAINSPGHLAFPGATTSGVVGSNTGVTGSVANAGVTPLSLSINSPGHLAIPGAATSDLVASNTGVTPLSLAINSPGHLAFPEGVPGSTVGLGSATGSAQPGVPMGTTFVGANQVGITGNTLTAVDAAGRPINLGAPSNTVGAVVGGTGLTNAATGTVNSGIINPSSLMVLQTSTGPILVAPAPGVNVPFNTGSSNVQLQGQLFQRGPLRLLIVTGTNATTGTTSGNLTGIPIGTTVNTGAAGTTGTGVNTSNTTGTVNGIP
jgi:hypothetical protein